MEYSASKRAHLYPAATKARGATVEEGTERLEGRKQACHTAHPSDFPSPCIQLPLGTIWGLIPEEGPELLWNPELQWIQLRLSRLRS